jgi:hypothetical protein
MSKCLYCEKPTPISKRGFPKKYCSDTCMSRYHMWKKTGKRYNENWGEGVKRTKKERKERAERYKWYCENWIPVDEVAKSLGITTHAVYSRAKRANVKWEVASGGPAPASFFDPNDIDKLHFKEQVIPEGYLSIDEAAEYLGYAKNTFAAIRRTELPFIELKRSSTGSKKRYYHVDDLKPWNDRRLKQKATKAKQKRLEKKKQKETIKLEEKRQKNAAIKSQVETNNKKWMHEDDACFLLGVKTLGGHIRNGRLDVKASVRKHGRWFDPAQVQELKAYLEELRSREPHIKYYTRDDDYTSVDAYENKLFAVKIPKLIQSGKWHSKKTGQLRKEFVISIENNKKWHNNRVNYGLIKKLDCKTCGKNLPYTSFLFCKTTRGRQKECKQCASLRNKNKYNPELRKQKRKSNYISKFRTLIGVQIKRDLTLQAKKYREDLSIPAIWKHIEEKLGYNAEDLCNHLKNQFEPWMRWDNHGRGNHGQFWQIDHIVPRSSLVFESLDDPNFAKCWALENMRPLCQHKNRLRYYKAT